MSWIESKNTESNRTKNWKLNWIETVSQIKSETVSWIQLETVSQIHLEMVSQINLETVAISELPMPMTELALDTCRNFTWRRSACVYRDTSGDADMVDIGVEIA